MALRESLVASVRDVVLAAVAAFVSALVAFQAAGDVSVPAVKAFAISAGYAVIRAVVGVISRKLSA